MSNIDKIIYSDIPFFRVYTSLTIKPKNMCAINLLKHHFSLRNADIINAASNETIKYLKVVFLKDVMHKVYSHLLFTYLPNKKQFKDSHLLNIKMFLERAKENDNRCGLKNIEKKTTCSTPSKPAISIENMEFIEVNSEFKTPEKASLIKISQYLSVLQINKLDIDEIKLIPPTLINNLKPKQAHLLSKEVIKNLRFKTIEQLDLGIVSEFSSDSIMELIKRISAHNRDKYNELARALKEVNNDRGTVSPLKLPNGVPVKTGAEITNNNKRRYAARKITYN